MVISGMKSSWRSIFSSVFHGPITDAILFNVLINSLDDGKECNLSKTDANLRGVDALPQVFAAILRDLKRLEKWTNRNPMQFSKEKYKLLHFQYKLGADHLEKVCRKILV